MKDVWNFVTPNSCGINRTEKFVKGSERYFLANNLKLNCEFFNHKIYGSDFAALVNFLKSGFCLNQAIGFLNLQSGDIEQLENNHWVTLAQGNFNGKNAEVTVFDGEKNFELDLLLWHKKTKKQGGFVFYRPF